VQANACSKCDLLMIGSNLDLDVAGTMLTMFHIFSAKKTVRFQITLF
jgi:hypothetical protein